MKAAFLVLLGALALTPAQARVVTYPAPPGEPLSTEYQVHMGTNSVDVYTARVLDPPFAGKEWDYGGPYSFANVDVSGPVEVRITSKRSLRDTIVRPASVGVTTRLDGDNTLILSLPGPRK